MPKSPSRFKCLCEKFRIDNGHLSIAELGDELGYKQSNLSNYETRAKGPPLDMVEKYCEHFKLVNEDRYNFFLAALETSEKIEVNFKKISPVFQETLFKFLAFVLSDQDVGIILEAGQKDRLHWASANRNSPYEKLENIWKNLKSEFSKFIEEAAREHEPIPKGYTTPQQPSE